MTEKRVRPKISIRMQARVFRRDGWLCRWCHRPVVLGPAMRLLEELVRGGDKNKPLAYYHSHWSRHSAPLLDHLGAVVDHIEAWATGGAHDEGNFATSCNKCNTRKNSKLAEAYSKLAPGKPVRGKYGEPT